jgi:hypothetical protein
MSNKIQTAVDWFSNRSYELFEQYSEGKFDRITLNKLMLEATYQAKEKEEEQLHKCASFWNGEEINKPIFNEYYTETYDNE